MKFRMKSLYNIVSEGKGHVAMRLGNGSSGVAYDLGNGWVKKTLRLASKHNVLGDERRLIDRWAKAKNLQVISPIHKWDGDSYEVEKLYPCPEAKWIDAVVWDISPQTATDGPSDSQLEKAKKRVGEEHALWVIDWLKKFNEDAKAILGTDHYSDDIRSNNIGKDKHGNVKCFDWCDPWSTRIP